VRGLDDPANPYRGKYAAWDRWALANAKEQRLVDWGAWNAGELPDSQRMIYVKVDQTGYPIPLLDQRAELIEQAHDPNLHKKNDCSVSFMAYGDMPPAMLRELQTAELAHKAKYTSKIPKWLADQPPMWAIVLPSGDVVTRGELGSGRSVDAYFTWRSSWNLPEGNYCRYDRQGQLAAKLAPGDEHWYKLFWPAAQHVLAQYGRAQTMTKFSNGCVIVQVYAGKEVLAVYDYDGTVLPASTDTRARDGNVWDGIIGAEIPALYAVQQQGSRVADQR